MSGNFVSRFFLIGSVFMILSMAGMGNDGKPYTRFRLNQDMVRFFYDSIPDNKTDNKKVLEDNADKKQVDLIKEVPKSRKQVKPIAVPVAVSIKPVQVIKPKIIKPIVKIK